MVWASIEIDSTARRESSILEAVGWAPPVTLTRQSKTARLDYRNCSQENLILRDVDMDNVTVQANSTAITPPEVTLIPNNSLLTDTPEEGRHLAASWRG